MSDRVQALLPQLEVLTAEEKELVIDILSDERGELTREEWEEAWVEEIHRRIADHQAGKTVAIPHDQFMKELKEKYG